MPVTNALAYLPSASVRNKLNFDIYPPIVNVINLFFFVTDAVSKQARVFVSIKPFRLIVIIVSKAEGYLRKVHPKGAPQGEDPALPSNIRTS